MKQKTAILLLFCFFYGLSAIAQAPTFASSTDLVLVPVQARRKGEHVSGLTKDIFTVLQDGQAQKIAVFEEVRTTTERLRRAPMGPGEFTNELQGNPNTARYTIIAIDRINTAGVDMARLREALLRFLAQAADSGEPIRLVAININGIQVLQDFTTDPKVLAAALQRVLGSQHVMQPERDLNETVQWMDEVAQEVAAGGNAEYAAALEQSLGRISALQNHLIRFRETNAHVSSLEALQDLALSLSGLPGRKSVIWASSGYPFAGLSAFGGSSAANRTFGINDTDPVYRATGLDEYTMHLLNTANIAVYPVDARGTINTAWEVMQTDHPEAPTSQQKEATRFRNTDIITTFEHVAQSTGGKACYERTDLSGCFKDAFDDGRDYYLVGYYINRQKLLPGWHKIEVKTAEKGLSVRSRTGFVLPKFTPEQTKTAEVKTELRSPMLAPGVPFRGSWTGTTPKGDRKSVGFSLLIGGNAALVSTNQTHLNLEVGALARTADGAIAGQALQHVERNLPPEAVPAIQASGISYKNSLELTPGKYLVRFVVRDNNTGRIGALSTVLTVE